MQITRRHAVALAAATPVFFHTPANAQAAPPDIGAVMPLVLATYRYLHEHPELGLQETLAHRRITQALRDFPSIAVRQVPNLPTALLAVLDTGRAGPCRALRAELDGLPIQEETGHDPRSTIDGRMHACGHDAHAAMLLGAAAYAAQNIDAFSGKLVFVFQPAEEVAGGANDIVDSGVLRDLGVQAIFAQHVAPGMPVGMISLAAGIAMAASYTFNLTLTGRGGHAAMPFSNDDLTLVAARFIEDLAAFPARRLDIANRPVVITTTKFEFQDPTTNQPVEPATNVLPGQIVLRGTIRALERLDAPPRGAPALGPMLRDYVERMATAYGVRHQWRVTNGAPLTINDEALYERAVATLRPSWGAQFEAGRYRAMTSEDFAYYTSTIPALYFGLGIAEGSLGQDGTIHSKDFTLSPNALPVGVRLLVQLARDVPIST